MWANALVSMFTMFWNLCLLRTGPERMPTTPAFIATVLVLDVALDIAALIPLNVVSVAAIGAIFATIATIAVATYGVLSLKGFQARFAATFVAIIGSDVVITLVQLALLPIALVLGEAVLGVVLFASLLWALAVIGFIFQRALEVGRGIGIAIGILLILAAANCGYDRLLLLLSVVAGRIDSYRDTS